LSSNSVLFILLFVPVLLSVFSVTCRYLPAAAAPLLVVASLIFYAWADPASLPLLLGSIVFNYWMTGLILRFESHRKLLAGLGVVGNLLPLVFFKYFRHVSPLGASEGLSIVSGIPLGLSFYTFQQITGLFDIQKKHATRLNLWEHALFGSFFPQVLAGPITRYRDLAPQIVNIRNVRVTSTQVCSGLSLFFIGLAKKLLVADSLVFAYSPIFTAVSLGRPLTFFEAWYAGWAFALQVYFDFSGYSDMAIGVASCLGITLAVNFNSPFKAHSGSNFVDRWHMSLVAWIREYLFQPLFNVVRRQPWGSGTSRATWGWVVATIVSMSVMGAWHGRRFLLLFGGALGGVLLVVLQLRNVALTAHRKPTANRGRVRRTLNRIALLATLIIVGMTVKADSFRTFLVFLGAMFHWRKIALPQVSGSLSHSQQFAFFVGGLLPNNAEPYFAEFILLLATILVLYLPNTMQIFGRIPYPNAPTRENTQSFRPVWRPTVLWGCCIGILMVAEIIFVQHGEGFVYANY
jgi:alginate O-acetyltransferase complex protein AlgI